MVKSYSVPTALPYQLTQIIPSRYHSEIIQTSILQNYSKGQLIISEAESDDRIRFLQSGWVSLSKSGKAVALLDKGFQSSNLDSEESSVITPYGIHAVNDVLIFSMPRLLFRQALLTGGENSVVAAFKVASNAFKTLLFYTSLKDDRPLEIRLADLYWHIGAKMQDGSKKIPDAIPQKIISSLLNVSREEVNRKKKYLMHSGYIVAIGSHEYLSPMTPLLIW